MEIRFCRHARRQMKWRKITEEEVRTAVINPDRLEDTRKGRKNALKTTQGRLLKITYKPEGDAVTVITAMARGE
jgi:hypothetical protein